MPEVALETDESAGWRAELAAVGVAPAGGLEAGHVGESAAGGQHE